MSKIQWTDQTPNPVVGCTKKSEGCENCYAIRMAWRLMHSPHAGVREKYAGTVKKTASGKLNWTGRINFDPMAMLKVINNKKPTLYFVNSMGDLFHPEVPFHKIDIVFAAMAIAHHHTFQILTKHPDRMLAWFNYKDQSWLHEGMRQDERIRFQTYHSYGEEVSRGVWQWPLPNVHQGTSVENQKAADLRIPFLLQVPAAVRFLSCEPLLGKIDLTPYLFNLLEKCPQHGIVTGIPVGSGDEYEYTMCPDCDRAVTRVTEDLHWIIAGGESGPGARPVHPDWIRSLREQCKSADVPFFFKQWGEYSPYVQENGETDPDVWINQDGKTNTENQALESGGDYTGMFKVGKHAAGNNLDGTVYEQFPRKRPVPAEPEL